MQLKTYLNMQTKDYLSEMISGLTISMILIPESIAFSFILGLPPSAGIHSTMIMSFITAMFGGCPALISGSTAAVATSLVGVQQALGQEYIYLAVILGGILQIIMGTTGIYKYIYDIPKPVSSGFLVALGILIGLSQIQHFKDTKTNKWIESDEVFTTIFFSLISMLITQYGVLLLKFSALVDFDINIPGGLVAIIILSMFFYLIPRKLPIQTVKDRGEIKSLTPSLNLPKVEWTAMNILKTLPFSFAMAIAGLTESLFMVKETGDLLKIQANPLKETIAQGVGNMLSGLAGGIGGCVLVGQSKFNLENGSKTRMSSICASLFFIIITLLLSSSIEKIPMPAIIGIMIVIAIKTGDWNSLFNNFGDKKWFTTAGTSLIGIASNSLTLGIIGGSVIHHLL